MNFIQSNTIIMYHGGRNLEYNYLNNPPSPKKRWEYGPGLYLTDHYETARKYAKGGGKVYKVEFQTGTNINLVSLSTEMCLDFIHTYVIGKHRKTIIEDIHNHCKRLNLVNYINAEVFLNLLINYDALTPNKTPYLTSFLANNGIDYSIGINYGGRDETILCLFNKKLIKKIQPTLSKDISIDEYNLNVRQYVESAHFSNKRFHN